MPVLQGETLGTFEHDEADDDFKGAWIFNPVKPGKYFVIRPLENEILDEGEDIEGGSELGGREEAERAMDSRPAAIIEVNLRSGVVM